MFQPFLVARRRFQLLAGRRERRLGRAPGGVAAGDPGAVDPREGVEQRPMAAWVEQAAIVVLAVDLDQQPAQLAQQRNRGRLVVDRRAAAAIRADDALDDHRFAGLDGNVIVGEEVCDGAVPRRLEGGGDHRPIGTMADQSAIGARADSKAKRIEQD